MSHTDKQREAITSWRRGDVCVIAGPGSGKTRVLVERVRWLVEEKGVDPAEILAITFTKKAAASMKARLVGAAAGNDELRRNLERAWISTIDAFCARLLRENALQAAIDPDFEILEPADAALELQAALDAALNEAFDADPAAAFRFLHAFHGSDQIVDPGRLTKIHAELAGVIEAFRGIGQAPFEIPQLDHPYPAERRWALAACRRALELFGEAKRAAGRLDFGDLTLRAIELLEAGAPLPARFRHVLVDENQDTNPLQERLLRALQNADKNDRPTLFAVGDLNQSIYAFRDAKPQVFRDYRARVQEQGGHGVELLENFRSRPEILAAAELLTEKAPGVEDRRLIAERPFAPLDSPALEVLIVRSEGDKLKAEAAWTAHRVTELKRSLRISVRPDAPDAPPRTREARWKDFAILGRTHSDLDAFAEALRDGGVPYQLSAGRGFFDAEEIRDLLGYLYVLDNPRDEVRLAAALRSPLGGLDELAILRLKAAKVNLADGLRRALEGPAAEVERVRRFRELLDRFRAEREQVSPDALLARIVAATGYEAWLIDQPGGAQRLANVAKLGRILAALDDGRRSYHEILERLAERRGEVDGETEASVPEDASDGVHLMTLHAAKGLEFPVVFMPSLHRGSGGSSSFLVSAEAGLGGRWLDAAGEKLEDAAYQAAHAALKQSEAEEANRLFYVGLTRAEERLILSASWGSSVRRTGSSKHLEKLKIDLNAVDAAPIEGERKGVRFRLFRTWGSPPPFSIEPLEAERFQLPRLEPFPPGGQADAAAAVTAVSVFSDCPRRYYLSRYLGLEEEPTAGDTDGEEPPFDVEAADAEPTGIATAGELGQAVHEILAGLREPGEGEAARLAGVFQAGALGRRAAAAPEVSRERKVLFPVGERLLRGVIDLVFADGEGRVLVDYKTDKVSTGGLDERARPYALQLQLYAVALERAGEKVDRAVLHFLRPDRLVEVDLSPAALQRAEEAAQELFAAQQSQKFETRPAPRCRRCPHYRNLCPAELPSPREPVAPGTQYSLF